MTDSSVPMGWCLIRCMTTWAGRLSWLKNGSCLSMSGWQCLGDGGCTVLVGGSCVVWVIVIVVLVSVVVSAIVKLAVIMMLLSVNLRHGKWQNRTQMLDSYLLSMVLLVTLTVALKAVTSLIISVQRAVTVLGLQLKVPRTVTRLCRTLTRCEIIMPTRKVVIDRKTAGNSYVTALSRRNLRPRK